MSAVGVAGLCSAREKKSHRQGRRSPTAKGEEVPPPREKKFGHARAQAFVDAFLEQEIIR